VRRWPILPLAASFLVVIPLASSLVACGTSLDLGSNDAGIPYDADCAPGTYSGTYQCTVAPGSPLTYSTSGPLTFVLAPAGAHKLAMPHDASLVAVASGTTSVSALVGELDCSNRQLVGHDGPIAFSSSSFTGTVTGTGTLTATYDGDASPPQLVDGILDSPPTLGSTCTWSAVHQP
jgi:hypothetical protein